MRTPPCSYSYRKWSLSVFGSCQRMPTSPVRKTSRNLSPTRSTIAWKSSFSAIPCWMLLMTESSAARCSVSFKSRCVWSNSRAFSSTTLILAASVCSSRTSDFAERILPVHLSSRLS